MRRGGEETENKGMKMMKYEMKKEEEKINRK